MGASFIDVCSGGYGSPTRSRRLYSRKAFISGAALFAGGLAGLLAPGANAGPTAVIWGLRANPEGPSCGHCRACRGHCANKIFATAASADGSRAHVGCRCEVVQLGAPIRAELYEALFLTNGSRTMVDRRYPWVQRLLQAEASPAVPTAPAAPVVAAPIDDTPQDDTPVLATVAPPVVAAPITVVKPTPLPTSSPVKKVSPVKVSPVKVSPVKKVNPVSRVNPATKANPAKAVSPVKGGRQIRTAALQKKVSSSKGGGSARSGGSIGNASPVKAGSNSGSRARAKSSTHAKGPALAGR